jgi:membrane protein
MGAKTQAVREELAQLGGDVRGLADALRNDPNVEQRKRLGWSVLYGGLAAGSTIVARKLANRTWHVLTGEGGDPAAGRNGHARKEQPVLRASEGHPKGTRRTPERPLPSDNSRSAVPDEAPEARPERAEPELAGRGVRDLSKADWVAIFKRAGKETLDDNVPMIASALAYASFFAIPSVLLVAVGMFTLVAGPDTIQNLMAHFNTFMPGDATTLHGQSLHQLDAKPSSGLVMTIVGFVLAVWSTTGAMNSYMTALNIAYDRKDRRTFLRKRLVALEMAAAIGFAFVLIAVLLIFGPAVQSWLGSTLHASTLLGVLWWTIQWPLLVVGLLAAFATTYYLGPDVDHPRWHFLTVGSVVAVVAWLAASGLFAVYTATFASYNKTWGSLSAVIVMLTWLWITGIALLFGAELNSEVEQRLAGRLPSESST